MLRYEISEYRGYYRESKMIWNWLKPGRISERNEAGFTILELLLAASLATIIIGSASMIIGQTFTDTGRTNDRLIALSGAENGAYWIGRDAAMADSVDTTDLIAPSFIVVHWTEWGYGTASVYHTVTYSIDNVTGDIGILNRRHQTSTGQNTTMRVADNIYYPSDDTGTSATFSASMLNLKMVAKCGTVEVVKEIKAYPRPN
jgi:hypothetical protein